MIAIGEYAVVNDTWNGKPVSYYVEPKFEQHARSIFPHTPEMLTFFSNQLNYPYPWQKYSQVVVRDYVSGAMENTTAVIFGEFMQGTDRELLDNLQNEKIVAHEMYHHWFGDLVTCESWANLTLNEGFANYSEYLWLEHKYGKDEADFHRLEELNGYLQSAQSGIHPLVHFGYDDKEDMFDAHSYNKGGLVLHMLRNYVGDDAFFAALNKYLKDNAFTDVEGHELRLAFEDVTGEDLNWFFNQWFFSQGHPSLEIDYDYDEEHQRVNVTVEQTQDPENMPAIFELPVAIDVYEGDKRTRNFVRVKERKQTFTFDATREPELIVFDGEGMLLAEKSEQKSTDEYIFQAKHASNLLHRIEALVYLSEVEDVQVAGFFEKALDDKFWLVRMLALDLIEVNGETGEKISALAQTDAHSSVREAALQKLAGTGDKKYVPLAIQTIAKDPSLKVVAAGLNALLELDKEAALAAAKKLESENDESIIVTLSSLYAETGDQQHLDYFDKKFDKVSGFAQFTFIENYATLAGKADASSMLEVAQKLKQLAMNESKFYWFRYLATNSINSLHGAISERIGQTSDAAAQAELKAADATIVSIIEEIKAWEKEEQLQEMYQQFPSPPVKP
jgi:aminopeptidase N